MRKSTYFDEAEAAYNAYYDHHDWKSVKGDPQPPFIEQSSELQKAWIAAAEACINEYLR